jgi:hypothetical protein
MITAVTACCAERKKSCAFASVATAIVDDIPL